jgi:hypothetical protein
MAGAVDEFGGFGGEEFFAEVFIDLDLDGFGKFRWGIDGGREVNVEGDFVGGDLHGSGKVVNARFSWSKMPSSSRKKRDFMLCGYGCEFARFIWMRSVA